MARARTAGVTLVEMLAALAVSAMIGVAGFALLDGATRTESAVAGRLEQLAAEDRAFRLLDRDVLQAKEARWSETGQLVLRLPRLQVVWLASATSVTRQLTYPDGQELEQQLLYTPAQLDRPQQSGRVLALRLTDRDVVRMFRHPPPPAAP